MMRRVVNAGLAFVGLVLTLPIMALAILAARLETRASGVFAQRRIGRNEREFTCYKLRTMRADTPDSSASHTVSGAYVTSLGKVWRKTKLDEIPQLWNVMIGDMDLIGPRPCLPTQSELIAARRDRGVFDVRPGITGYAQVQGVDMADPERLAKLDAEYIAKRSLQTDLQITIQTLTGAGYGDRVEQ